MHRVGIHESPLRPYLRSAQLHRRPRRRRGRRGRSGSGRSGSDGRGRGRRVGDRLHLRLHFTRRLEACIALLFEGPHHDLVDPRVQRRLLGRRPEAAERQFTGQQFIEHHAERVDVGALVDVGRRLDLLGRHVVRAAEDGALHGQRDIGPLVATDQLGDAEVGDFHAPAGIDEDVLRLDVPVEDALFVRELESGTDVLDEGERFRRR